MAIPASDLDDCCEELSRAHTVEPPFWLGTGANVFISIGLAGTFFGLSYGLVEGLPKLLEITKLASAVSTPPSPPPSGDSEIINALRPILEGAKLAFVKSLAGVVAGTVWTVQMARLHHLSSLAQESLRNAVVRAFPSVTPEALLAQTLNRLVEHHDRANAQHAATRDLLVGFQTTVVASLGPVSQLSALDPTKGWIAPAVAPLAQVQASSQQAADRLATIQRGEEASFTELIRRVGELRTAIEAATRQLPQSIGDHTGNAVGRQVKPSLDQIGNALVALSNQGGEAVGDAFKASVGRETNDLRDGLAALTNSLALLSSGIAQSGLAAQETLRQASDQSAQGIVHAARQLDAAAKSQATEAAAVLSDLKSILERLSQSGTTLKDAFEGVASPLRALPSQLVEAQKGIEGAATAAAKGAKEIEYSAHHAATDLERGGDAARKALELGAGNLASHLASASEHASQHLSAGASQATDSLQRGARAMEDSLQSSGQGFRGQLQESLATELAALSTEMKAQASAQQYLLRALKEERNTSAAAAEESRRSLHLLRESSATLQRTVTELSAGVRTLTTTITEAGETFRDQAESTAQSWKSAGEDVSHRMVGVVTATEQGHKAALDGAERLRVVVDQLETAARHREQYSDQIVSRLQEALAGLSQSGTTLQVALQGVAEPLRALPTHIQSASKGMENAAHAAAEGARKIEDSAHRAADDLQRGGKVAKEALESGADTLSSRLGSASQAVGQHLSAAAQEATQTLQGGADAMRGTLQSSGERFRTDLHEGLAAELDTISRVLAQQAQAQQDLLSRMEAERTASARAAETSRETLRALQESNATLQRSVLQLNQEVGTLARTVSEAGGSFHEQAQQTAQSWKEAGIAVTTQLAEVVKTTQAANDAMERTSTMSIHLKEGGDALTRAFGAVTTPLVTLPHQLTEAAAEVGRAKQGMEAVGATLQQSSAAFHSEAKGAGAVLSQSGRELAAAVASARTELAGGLTAELGAVRNVLNEQITAQNLILESTREQQRLMDDTARAAHAQWAHLHREGQDLIKGIESLRSTCVDTVATLQAASGDQRASAGDAIQQLLLAVQTFSSALESAQGEVQAASLRAVASTEQVTVEAAKRVAEALDRGASHFVASMSRVEEVGNRLDAHGTALATNVAAAEKAAEQLRGHGNAMVESAGKLKSELEQAARPLNDARSAMMGVPGAVQTAVGALHSEQKALATLGDSLKNREQFVREHEAELRQRVHGLQAVTNEVGKQIVGQVDRLAQAQGKVAEGWKVAMEGVDLRVRTQAKEIAEYAQKVEQALGLNHRVNELNESLAELAHTLNALKSLPTAVATLNQNIATLSSSIQTGRR